jgi:hypothetical protein
MKPITAIGICLIVFGILAAAYQGMAYTTREKALDFGALEATAQKETTIPLLPLLGALVWSAGSFLVALGNRRS